MFKWHILPQTGSNDFWNGFIETVDPKDCLMVGDKWQTDIIKIETIGIKSFFKNTDTFEKFLENF